jgi:hypothetical protein
VAATTQLQLLVRTLYALVVFGAARAASQVRNKRWGDCHREGCDQLRRRSLSAGLELSAPASAAARPDLTGLTGLCVSACTGQTRTLGCGDRLVSRPQVVS